MVEYLHPNFLSDPGAYERAEALWQERWQELMRRLGQQGEWISPWINTNFVNGTPCRDGNPVFSAVCASRRLGIRVIQLEPRENPQEWCFWADTFAKGEKEEVQELVISCALTEQTLGRTIDLMQQWVKEGAVHKKWTG